MYSIINKLIKFNTDYNWVGVITEILVAAKGRGEGNKRPRRFKKRKSTNGKAEVAGVPAAQA